MFPDINLEDTDLQEEKITFENLNFKNFIPFLLKRFWIFALKIVGSRTMMFTTLEYLTSIVIMKEFAKGNLKQEAMLYILYIYIVQSIFILIMFGLLKFNPINTDVKLGK
jgi:hypothetical protein